MRVAGALCGLDRQRGVKDVGRQLMMMAGEFLEKLTEVAKDSVLIPRCLTAGKELRVYFLNF